MELYQFHYWMYVLRYLNRYDSIIESQIAKELGVTYSHTVKILYGLSKDGMVSFNVKGRSKFVSLTPKGKALADLVDKLMSNRNILVMVQRTG